MTYAWHKDGNQDGEVTSLVRKKDDAGSTSHADNVVDLSGRRKPPSRKGIPATAKQRAALKRGQDKAHQAAKDRRKREAKEGKPKSRWKQLCDGEITVGQLDLDELKRMQTKDALGAFGGRAPAVPARLARDMKAELLRRGQAIIDSAYPEAVALLQSVVADKRQKTSDRIKAAQLLVERSAGRMPETVRLEKTATWDETFEDVVTVTEGQETDTG